MAPRDDGSSEALHFSTQAGWAQWLARNHDGSDGVWVRHAKKGAPEPSVTHIFVICRRISSGLRFTSTTTTLSKLRA
ncbi:hypothetical protein D3872_01565 [Massilia cavernae]|uniref:Uncharacterized protein n=1 Tax=Massilia cavernae TaxID=2320864 RepID=A0A418Y808_9BURK|nr:hypothetical protein D3872_01565 [Massilia cavernae]